MNCNCCFHCRLFDDLLICRTGDGFNNISTPSQSPFGLNKVQTPAATTVSNLENVAPLNEFAADPQQEVVTSSQQQLVEPELLKSVLTTPAIHFDASPVVCVEEANPQQSGTSNASHPEIPTD